MKKKKIKQRDMKRGKRWNECGKQKGRITKNNEGEKEKEKKKDNSSGRKMQMNTNTTLQHY